MRDVQLSLPDPVVEELVAVGIVGPNRVVERRGGLPVEAAFAAMVVVTGVAASVTSLIVDGPEAARRIARALTAWRRSTTPEMGKGFSLVVMRPNRHRAHIELSDDPDPEVLFEFLRNTVFDD